MGIGISSFLRGEDVVQISGGDLFESIFLNGCCLAEDFVSQGSFAHSQQGSFDCGNMGFIHGLEWRKKFFSHLNLVFKGSVGMIGIVKGSEGGFMDDFGLEGKV